MPGPSPDHPGPIPSSRSVFAGSGDLATEIVAVADGSVNEMESTRRLDPDQVPDPRARKRLGVGFWIATGWFLLVVLAAVAAPILPLPDPDAINTSAVREAPSPAHIFGTDELGRDIFTRAIWGARVSLIVGFASIIFGLVVGGTMGIVAGYVGGRLERLLMGIGDVLLSFPALLLAIAIVSFSTSRSLPYIVVAIGVVAIAPVARLVRASTLVFSNREFVTASRALGASNTRIVVREILPNVIFPVMSFSIILVAVAIVAEGGLAFLGLSVQPPTPTWGGMISDGRRYLETAPWISLMPCLVMFLTVLALNLAGDRLREFFDIKEGSL